MEPKIIQPDYSGGEHGGPQMPLAKKLSALLALVIVAAVALFVADWLQKTREGKLALLPGRLPDAMAIVLRIEGDSLWAERQVRNEEEKYRPATLEILMKDATVFAKLAKDAYPVGAEAEIIEKASLKAGDVVLIWVPVRPFAETLKNPVAPELVIPLEDMLTNPRERLAGEYIAVVGK